MKPENGGTDDVDGVKRVDYSGKQQGCIGSNCACTVKVETVLEAIQYILISNLKNIYIFLSSNLTRFFYYNHFINKVLAY